MSFGIHELPQQYDLNYMIMMRPQGPHMPITEAYVAIPPALWIRDDENALWTLGFDYSDTAWRSGKYEFDVVRNGRNVGEFARIIEFRKRVIRIWGADGWRAWNGRCFV